VFAALDLANFPRRVVMLNLYSQDLLDYRNGSIPQLPSSCPPYIRAIEIEKPSFDRVESENANVTLTDFAREGNIYGFHMRGYNPSHPKLLEYLRAMTGVDALRLQGCEACPRLRHCDDCHDLFMNGFNLVTWTHLTDLELWSVYSSGGHHRSFIKRYARTLFRFNAIFTTLTDGTWKSVVQGLLKLPHLKGLHLGKRLCQKQEKKLTGLFPATIQYEENTIDVEGASNVRTFLAEFVQYFHTREYVHEPTIRNPPMYHEVRLIGLDGVSFRKGTQMRSNSALARYAQDVV